MDDQDRVTLHPDLDIDFEPGQGSVNKRVKTFVQHSVKSPLSNQQRRRDLDNYPLPDIEELRPPKLD